MHHVEDIRRLMSSGQMEEAQSHLDSLLVIGPKNTQALKIKAQLLQVQGRFEEQAKVWQQIASIDPEDIDAILFFQRKFIDEREHFYFTEDAKSGGKRFLAVPRSAVQRGLIGMIGCLLFFMMPRLAAQYPQHIGDREVIFAFLLLVVAPWVALIMTYLQALRFVEVDSSGLQLIGRLRKIKFQWGELDKITICHSLEHPDYLGVILTPKAPDQRPVFLNLSEHESTVRAKSFFIAETRKHFTDIVFVAYEHLNNIPKRLIIF